MVAVVEDGEVRAWYSKSGVETGMTGRMGGMLDLDTMNALDDMDVDGEGDGQ